MATEAPNLSEFFSAVSKEEMESTLAELEQHPNIVESANQAPAQLHSSLDAASDEFLRGYLLGVNHATSAIYTMMEAVNRGDQRVMLAVRQRIDSITYLVCRRLTTGGSRIILSS